MQHELLIFGVSILAVLMLFVGLPLLLAKFGKLDITKYIDDSKFVLGFMEKFVKGLPLQSAKTQIVGEVLHYAELGVGYVEDLYKAGQLPQEDRKAKAIEFVEKALTENKIQLGDKEKAFIENSIEVMVFLLPKTHA